MTTPATPATPSTTTPATPAPPTPTPSATEEIIARYGFTEDELNTDTTAELKEKSRLNRAVKAKLMLDIQELMDNVQKLDTEHDELQQQIRERENPTGSQRRIRLPKPATLGSNPNPSRNRGTY